MLCLLQIAYSDKLKKDVNRSKENHLCWNHDHIVQWFPVKIEIVLKGIFLAKNSFQGGDRLCLLQVGLFR
jgi:hypothetical protein